MDNNILFTLSHNNLVANITFNNIKNYNAFDLPTIIQFNKYITKASLDKNIKIIVIKANSKHFSSGADLKWMQQSINYTKKQNIADANQLAFMLLNLYNCNKLIICAIQGNVYGGAIGIVACSDIVIAVENARLCFSEIKLGLAPAIISQFVLKSMNNNFAKYYMLTAKPFTAKQALQAGLVHKVIKLNTLEQHVIDHIKYLLDFNQQGIMTTKKLLRQQRGTISMKYLHTCVATIAKLRTSAACQILIKNFLK